MIYFTFSRGSHHTLTPFFCAFVCYSFFLFVFLSSSLYPIRRRWMARHLTDWPFAFLLTYIDIAYGTLTRGEFLCTTEERCVLVYTVANSVKVQTSNPRRRKGGPHICPYALREGLRGPSPTHQSIPIQLKHVISFGNQNN